MWSGTRDNGAGGRVRFDVLRGLLRRAAAGGGSSGGGELVGGGPGAQADPGRVDFHLARLRACASAALVDDYCADGLERDGRMLRHAISTGDLGHADALAWDLHALGVARRLRLAELGPAPTAVHPAGGEAAHAATGTAAEPNSQPDGPEPGARVTPPESPGGPWAVHIAPGVGVGELVQVVSGAVPAGLRTTGPTEIVFGCGR